MSQECTLNFSSSRIKEMKKEQVKIVLIQLFYLISATKLSTFQHGINTKIINGHFILLSLN